MKPHALLILLVVVMGCGKAKDDEYSVPSLIKALHNENADVRYSAAKTLGSYGMVEDGVLQALRDAAKDQNPAVRIGVVYALMEIGPTAAPALPELQTALRADDNKDVRVGAAMTLGSFGVASRDALPALQEAARNDSDADVRTQAQKAIKAIESKIPGLTRQ